MKTLAGRLTVLVVVFLGAVISFWASAGKAAQPPQWLNYQGRLTTPQGVPVGDSSYQVVFRLFDVPTGGSPLWTETGTVTTRAGVFNSTLGKTSGFAPALFTKRLWLEIEVASRTLQPRQELGSVAFAMTALTMPDGSVTTAMIADLSVTTAKLADGAVTTAKLADGVVTSLKVADNAVTSTKLAEGSVVESKIADGAVSAKKLKAESWTSYTPTWTGGSPSIGDGTLTGRYTKMGSTVTAVVAWKPGGSTNFGAGGDYYFGLPFQVSSSGSCTFVGSAFGYNSGLLNYTGVVIAGPGSAKFVVYLGGSTNSCMCNTYPHTWKAGDQLLATITYETES